MEGIGRARSNRNRKPTTLHIFSPPLSTHPFNYTDFLLHSTQPPPHGPHCAASPTNAAQHLIHDPPTTQPPLRGQPNNAPPTHHPTAGQPPSHDPPIAEHANVKFHGNYILHHIQSYLSSHQKCFVAGCFDEHIANTTWYVQGSNNPQLEPSLTCNAHLVKEYL